MYHVSSQGVFIEQEGVSCQKQLTAGFLPGLRYITEYFHGPKNV